MLLTIAMQPVNLGADIRYGGAELNGAHYGNSIVHQCSPFCSDPRSDVEYNLGRRYRRFEALVGVLDDATDAWQTGYFQVFLDGAAQPQQRVVHGAPVRIRHDVSGTLRLRLVAYRPDTVVNPVETGAKRTGGRLNNLPELAWGDPTLYE